MEYGSYERAAAEATLSNWFTAHADISEGRARGMAHSLANREQPTIRRKALMHTLEESGDEDRAAKCFELLCESGIITLESGDPLHPRPGNLFRIHPPLESGTTAKEAGAPCFNAFQPASDYIAQHMDALERNPGRAERFIDKLMQLDQWLARAEQSEPVPASVNQRSYDIFNDEKALTGHLEAPFGKLLKSLGVDANTLAIIKPKRPKLDIFVPYAAKGPLLVVENGDTFESLKHVMGAHGQTRILGQQLGGIVHGAGTSVCTPESLDQTLRAVGYTLDYVLYWGDIDRSGVTVLTRAREVCNVKIKIAKPFYQKMVLLQKARMRRGIPIEDSGKQSFPEKLDEVAHEMPLMARWVFLKTIRGSKRIPQEVVTISDLLAQRRGTRK